VPERVHHRPVRVPVGDGGQRDRPSGPLYRFLENQLPILGAMVITVIGVLLTTFALIRLDLIDPVKFTV
jgi:hypothetical protein